MTKAANQACDYAAAHHAALAEALRIVIVSGCGMALVMAGTALPL
ncbi:hypothetical protein [Alteripontixanthobacter maritimus]|nr:hypothetical protein [Alteripontixanthobacter maritimus]